MKLSNLLYGLVNLLLNLVSPLMELLFFFTSDISRAIELLDKLQRTGEVPPQKLQALQRVLQSEFCNAVREVRPHCKTWHREMDCFRNGILLYILPIIYMEFGACHFETGDGARFFFVHFFLNCTLSLLFSKKALIDEICSIFSEMSSHFLKRKNVGMLCSRLVFRCVHNTNTKLGWKALL